MRCKEITETQPNSTTAPTPDQQRIKSMQLKIESDRKQLQAERDRQRQQRDAERMRKLQTANTL